MTGVNLYIDGLQRAEGDLSASEQRMRAIFDGTVEYIGLLAPDGTILEANRSSLEFADSSRDEVLGKPFPEGPWFANTAGAPERAGHAVARASAGERVRFDTTLIRPSGETMDCDISLHPVRGKSGNVIFIVPEIRDITDRNRAKESQRQQWQTFDAIISSTPDLLYAFDLEGRYTFANRALVATSRRSLEATLGKTPVELGYPADLCARIERQFRQVIETRQNVRAQTAFTLPGGELRHYDYIYAPVLDDRGEVVAVAGSTRDITEQKRASERLEAALNSADVGIWTWDIPRDIVVCDPNMAFLFGVENTAYATGLPIGNFIQRIHPDDQPIVSDALDEIFLRGGKYGVDFRVFSADGKMRWLSARGLLKTGQDGQPLSLNGLVLDLTERKRAEELLRDSEARFRQLIDFLPQMVWSALPDGCHDLFNRQVFEYTGLSLEEIQGDRWDIFLHPEDRPRAREQWERSLATSEQFEIEYRCRRADGEYHWFLGRAAPILDEQGRVVRWFGTSTDIHGQKLHEAALGKANRELEEFSHMASHDLQEPLRTVNIYSQLILKNMRQGDPALEKYAEFLRGGVSRMETLIRDLLVFSQVVHREPLPAGTANLSRALDEALAVLSDRITENDALIVAEELPEVRGDTEQLAHVFQNIVSNALKYRNKERRPEISVTVAAEGTTWIISVRDNGIGFEQQHAERIFGLFKRLHGNQVYPGTGLGLAICKRIVESYGGRIWAEGKPGEGATVSFSLPGI